MRSRLGWGLDWVDGTRTLRHGRDGGRDLLSEMPHCDAGAPASRGWTLPTSVPVFVSALPRTATPSILDVTEHRPSSGK